MGVEPQKVTSNLSVGKRISVLHVGKYFPPFSGGMENFLADLIKSLALEGITASVVVHDHDPYLRIRPGSEAVGGGRQVVSIATCSKSFLLYRVPSFGRLLYAPISPQFPYWLRWAIRTENPDLLHLHLPNTSAFWVLCLREAREIPWVIHWHADVVSSEVDRWLKLAYPLYRQFERRLLERAEAVVVTSPTYLNHSQALAPWHHKCRVVPLGLDPARIPSVGTEARDQAQLSWRDAGFRILSVGRLTYYKGHEYLVRAVMGVPGARAIIVGEGERRQLLERTISEQHADDRVVLAGGVPSEQLHALMESCDCVCLPSIERTEAFGVALLEAMAHGKPTVVCDITGSGVSWVVKDGVTGCVVPPADATALSEALRALSLDRESLSRMGAEGRQRYENMFRIDRVGSEIRELYEEMLKTRGLDD